MRKMAQLEKEAEKNGLKVGGNGKGPSKADYEVALRDFYWNRDWPGDKMLQQVEPEMAHNIKDVEEADSMWMDGSNYGLQLKLDGCRFLMHILDGKIRFTSRRKSDKTFLYSEKTENFYRHLELPIDGLEDSLFDGEMVYPHAVINTGAVETKSALQAAVAITNSGADIATALQEKYGAIVYHVFDVIRYKGEDVTAQPYNRRLEVLKKAFEEAGWTKLEIIKMVPTFYTNKKATYEEWVKQGMEGGMLKARYASYRSGKRTWDWLKVKRFEDVDAVVTGFIRGDSEGAYANMVGALEVSCVDKRTGELRGIASVSAMPLEFRKSITIYDAERNEVSLKKEIYNKVLVVRGQELTRNIRMKHAVILPNNPWETGNPFRDDKAPDQCSFDFERAEEKIAVGGRV